MMQRLRLGNRALVGAGAVCGRNSAGTFARPLSTSRVPPRQGQGQGQAAPDGLRFGGEGGGQSRPRGGQRLAHLHRAPPHRTFSSSASNNSSSSSSSSSSSTEPALPPPVPVPDGLFGRWVTLLNSTVHAAPMTAMSAFLALRSGTWYSLVFLLNTDVIPLTFGAQWGVAYLVLRVTGKLRQPLNVAISAGLLKAFPVLGCVKASALMGVIKVPPVSHTEEDKARDRRNGEPYDWVAGGTALLNKLNGPLDKYGFAYYLAAKVSIAAVLVGGALAVDAGVDVKSVLLDWGVSEGIQNGAGSMAGATMINLCILPAHFLALPHVLKAVEPMSTGTWGRVMAPLQRMEEEERERERERERRRQNPPTPMSEALRQAAEVARAQGRPPTRGPGA